MHGLQQLAHDSKGSQTMLKAALWHGRVQVCQLHGFWCVDPGCLVQAGRVGAGQAEKRQPMWAGGRTSTVGRAYSILGREYEGLKRGCVEGQGKPPGGLEDEAGRRGGGR